jgi:hypothetical protein
MVIPPIAPMVYLQRHKSEKEIKGITQDEERDFNRLVNIAAGAIAIPTLYLTHQLSVANGNGGILHEIGNALYWIGRLG